MITSLMVQEARRAAVMTQEQAGRTIGAARRTWQDWEAGRRRMPIAKYNYFLLLTVPALRYKSQLPSDRLTQWRDDQP